MDKRRNQRVAFALGLLFLLILAALGLCKRTERILSDDRAEILSYMLESENSAGDMAAAVFGDRETSEENVSEGRKTAEKYGYEEIPTVVKKQVWQLFFPVVILFICAFFLVVYLIIRIGKWLKEEQLFRFEQEDRVKQLEAENALLADRMKQEEARTKTLVTDISHQLKTPLASLKMCYEIADTSNFTPEEQHEFLMQGKEEVKKLENLTQSLLQLSRLESHMVQIQREMAGIKKTIRGAMNSVYMKAFDKGIEMEVNEFEEEEIFHDPRWTQEALVNVLDNAVKYSPAGSRIHIRVTAMTSNFLIEVEDEGLGVSTEEANQIFKRFYRGESSRRTSVEGSGVGLYLAREILEEQGGTIRVKKGRAGSNFMITLPRKFSYKTVIVSEKVL